MDNILGTAGLSMPPTVASLGACFSNLAYGIQKQAAKTLKEVKTLLFD